jgi:hypothetical protein
MPNRNTDALFLLIKSLQKSEKRNFKLYVNRNTSHTDLKVIILFDALDKMKRYDELVLLRKNEALQKQQLSNLKAHLYKLILSSLRLIKQEDNITIQLNEQMDFARILYNKGLYLQSLKVLDKIKELSKEYHQITNLQQVLFFEKKIETLFITRSLKDRADILSKDSQNVEEKLALINKLSNLSLRLYGWYIEHGVARNEKDEQAVSRFFLEMLPKEAENNPGFYERLYLYQVYCWSAFIKQDFLGFYRNAQRWVDLFEANPVMIEVETGHYIKAFHNLMGAHFDLKNHKKLVETLQRFELFSETKLIQQNENNRIQCFVYLYLVKLNMYFIEGRFTEGLNLVPVIEKSLHNYELYIDSHRVLVFYYKIGCLYFGSGNHKKAIAYLNKIINLKTGLRSDLQCYARLLNLIAHYELGHYDLLEYQLKSVYRFMAKLENLSSVENALFKFLPRSFSLSPQKMQPAFEQLLVQVKQFEGNRFETRSFVYLDVISWLESKVNNVPVQDVIRAKFLARFKTDA